MLPSPGRKKEINISSQSEKYPYVSLFPDLLCNIGWSVSGLREIRLNAYTPRRFSTEKSVRKQTRIPVVRVDNFRWE